MSDPVAEAIMSGAVRMQIEKLGTVGRLHQPRSNIAGDAGPACPECLGGIFAVDAEVPRACGCWGLMRPICGTCAVRHENGHWSRVKWPCETWKALINDV